MSASDLPPLDELADEIDRNPKVFALRFAELMADVKDMRDEMRKGKWLAVTVLVGLLVDLLLRYIDTKPAAQVAQAVLHAVT